MLTSSFSDERPAIGGVAERGYIPRYTMGTELRVRGSAYHSAREFVSERFGAGAVEQVLEALPVEARAAFADEVDRHAWAPLLPWVAFLGTMDRLLGRGDLALVRESGRWAALRDLPALFPDLARMGRPVDIIALASKFWNSYYDSGRAEAVATEEPDTAVFEAVGFALPTLVHCQRVLGWIAGAFAKIAVEVEMTMPSCRAAGHERCLYVARGAGLRDRLQEPRGG